MTNPHSMVNVTAYATVFRDSSVFCVYCLYCLLSLFAVIHFISFNISFNLNCVRVCDFVINTK